MSALELLYDFFEDHVHAAALIDERRPVAVGVLGFVLGAVALFVAQGLAQRHAVLAFSYASCLLVVLIRLAVGFAVASVVHLILDLGDVKGSAVSLFIQFGLADLSWALAVPAILLLKLAAPGSSWPATGFFFAIWLVTLGLKARGLKDTYRVSLGRAWATLVLPYVAVAVASLLALSLAVVGMAMQLIKAVG